MSTAARLTLLQNTIAHKGSVTCSSIGPRTGLVFATGGEDKMFNLWGVNRQQPCASFGPLNSYATSCEFKNMEEIIFVGNKGGSGLLYDIGAAKLIGSWGIHRSSVNCVTFDPTNEQNMATAGDDGFVKLLSQKSPSPYLTWSDSKSPINCVTFSSDGKYLASAGDDGTVRVYDIAAGNMLVCFETRNVSIKTVRFHPTEDIIVTGGSDRAMRFFDLATFTEMSPLPPLNTSEVLAVHFASKGSYAFGASSDLLSVVSYDTMESCDRLKYSIGKLQDFRIIENNIVLSSSMKDHIIINRVKVNSLNPFNPSASKQKETNSYCTLLELNGSPPPKRRHTLFKVQNPPILPQSLCVDEKEVFREFKKGRPTFRTEMNERYARINRIGEMLSCDGLTKTVRAVAQGGDLQLELATVVLKKPRVMSIEHAGGMMQVAVKLFGDQDEAALALIDCILNIFGKIAYATLKTNGGDVAFERRKAYVNEMIKAFKEASFDVKDIASMKGPLQKTANDILDQWGSLL